MVKKSLATRQFRRMLVRMPNWIGDAVMATPALHDLRSTCPAAEIVVVANPLVAELFREHPDCDRVLVYDRQGAHRGLGGLWRFSCQLRRERFDLAVLLQNAFEAALVALLAGIPRRAGYRTDGRGLLLTDGVPAVDKKHGLHHVDYYRHCLAQLGITGGSDTLRLAVTAAEQQWAAETLGPGRWLAINPGASYGAAKRWLPERFAAVADGLAARYAASIVLTGGPGEREIGRDIEKAMQVPVRNLIGQTSVREMMALLARCELMITNDSGPMHVAAALGTPLVAVFGPTDHTTTSPAAERCRIVRQPVDCAPCMLRECPVDHRCMTGITADQVLAAAAELLGDRR
ncbi:MAG: lipopolysaccharide heptosyltransferase II [Desulfuromonadales bacterium]|nr:lipopolysaccharide heptosyltransferase II [Desulfuromonadales bacterium]